MPRRGGLSRRPIDAAPPRASQVSPPEPLLHDPLPGFGRWALHRLYGLAWWTVGVVCAPLLAWRARDPAFRRMLAERMGKGLPTLPAGRRRVLVHGVSVGEVKGAAALVHGLESLGRGTSDPGRGHGLELVVSTTTDTGQKVAREAYKGTPVVRFPFDVASAVERFLDRVRPTAVVLVELEVWPNFLRACNRRGIPVVVVNGRITDRSHARYRRFRSLLPQFRRVSYFAVQSDEYAQRFGDLGVEAARLSVTGNIKFDALRLERRVPSDELVRRVGVRDGRPILVAGSTHEPEERLVVEAWREHAPEARLVLVPRHPERSPELVEALARLGPRPERLSELRGRDATGDPARPLVVDTIGELEEVYALADLVFVGGTLIPHGGQNLLEPAAQAKPVLRGRSVENFVQEAALLDRAEAALEVADAASLGRSIAALLADPERARAMGARGQRAVERQRGATERTLAATGAILLAGRGLDENGKGARP